MTPEQKLAPKPRLMITANFQSRTLAGSTSMTWEDGHSKEQEAAGPLSSHSLGGQEHSQVTARTGDSVATSRAGGMAVGRYPPPKSAAAAATAAAKPPRELVVATSVRCPTTPQSNKARTSRPKLAVRYLSTKWLRDSINLHTFALRVSSAHDRHKTQG